MLTEYWPIIVTVVVVVMAYARLETSVEVMKEKIKTLFDLFNDRKK